MKAPPHILIEIALAPLDTLNTSSLSRNSSDKCMLNLLIDVSKAWPSLLLKLPNSIPTISVYRSSVWCRGLQIDPDCCFREWKN